MLVHSITKDTELRLIEPRHAAALFKVVEENREYLREWFSLVDAMQTLAETTSLVKHILHRFAEGQSLQLGIWRNNALVGCLGFNTIDNDNRKADVFYWLSASAQGKGVITQACRALVDYGFHELGLERIEIRCASGNTRSRAIPERLGFTLEGVQRRAEKLHNQHIDLVMYSMVASEWVSSHQVSL